MSKVINKNRVSKEVCQRDGFVVNLFMRYLILIVLFFTCPAFAASTSYFSAVPDLPIAPVLAEAPGSAVGFDQPEGRIVVLQAEGESDAAAILGFYARTLPALGWQRQAPGRYSRGREILLLEVKKTAGRLTRLNIMVRPL